MIYPPLLIKPVEGDFVIQVKLECVEKVRHGIWQNRDIRCIGLNKR